LPTANRWRVTICVTKMFDPLNFFRTVLITMQNLVALSHTAWAYVGGPKSLGCCGSLPWERDPAWPCWNTFHFYTCYRIEFGRSKSNPMCTGRFYSKIHSVLPRDRRWCMKQAVRESAMICPRPGKLTFNLLTLKAVFESRVTWATFVSISVFLGLSVLDLGPMYATDRQTPVRQTSDKSIA